MRKTHTALANTWLGALALGLIVMALLLANQQGSPLALRLTWFIATVPLSIGLIAALRDLLERPGRPVLHLRAMLPAMIIPGTFFLIQMVIYKMEDASATAGPTALGSPVGDATALVFYMALWWAVVLFVSAFLLDMLRPSAGENDNTGEGTTHAN